VTRDVVSKAWQAVLLWAIALAVVGTLWPPALGLPRLWAVVAVSALVNVLQPAYALTARAGEPEDRGTFVQIVGSVYAIQVAALVELVARKPAPLTFDATALGALAAMVGGLTLRAWAVRTLGRSFTLELRVEPGQRVVEDGPYRWLRHPSYAGAWLAIVASCALLGSSVAAALGAIVLAAGFRRRIRHEERLLAERCPGYTAYAARTGALLPRLW
jgi:protein-S-isoprenylcysteine O-methyltransferase